MLIVDSQVHIWGANTPDRPWPPGGEARAQKPYPVTKEMLLEAMDEAGVNAAILVPPSWEGERNDLVMEAARTYPKRFAAMGRLGIERPESRALVAGWKEQAGMLGIRLTFHIDTHRAWLTDGTADWLWPAAENSGVPIMVFPPGSAALFDPIAARHPGLRLVIDHLALGGTAKDAEAFWELPQVLKLAKHPNLAVKVSALPCFSSERYPFPGLHDYIRRVYDVFGPNRMFWGTDWTRLPCTYKQAITLFTEEQQWLPAKDLETIMGRGLCEWLGWELGD